jgi:hypothetical protein
MNREENVTPPPQYFYNVELKLSKRLQPFREELFRWEVLLSKAPNKKAKKACENQIIRLSLVIGNIQTMAEDLCF